MKIRPLFLQLVAAFVIVLFMTGLNNDPLPVVARRAFFFKDLILNTVVTLFIIVATRQISLALDRWMPWSSSLWRRSGLQFIFAIIIPAALAYLAAYLQYRFIIPDHVFGGESFLNTEFPVIVLFIVLINIFLVVEYFYEAWQASKQEKSAGGGSPVPPAPAQIVCRSGARQIVLSEREIALLQLEENITRIYRFDGSRLASQEPLNKLMKTLDTTTFFRANRQCIVNRAACRQFRSIEFGKIELLLVTPLSAEVIISQKTAPRFRKWIEKGGNG